MKTDDQSTLDLAVSDVARIRMTPGTRLEVQKFRQPKFDSEYELQLKLDEGRILCAARPMMPASKIEILQPKGVCGIRSGPKGADGRFEVNASGRIASESATIIALSVDDNTIRCMDCGMAIVMPGYCSQLISQAPYRDLKAMPDAEFKRLQQELADFDADAKKGKGRPKR